ncbi:MAG: DUF4143 domain-containing protein [Kiritimatiellae bacterium]|nr:DUF4143 domain-containing protein [Kiritimatiellia bacterium]MDD3545710.1 DUF4143 domain-containing protein [Kiritimatiellia bacterium]MDD4623284.1 DUF4143 domain-containing protein [Kiritimatiellia bacterium]
MDIPQYRPRLIDKRLDFYLSTFGAVCVEGPKCCGKTWTSTIHAKSAYLLADPADNFANRELAKLDVNKALEGEVPHLIDEWQEVPAIWDAVRFSVDKGTETGRFLLTGSSTPVNKGIMHSGTGRIAGIPMHPMSLFESGDSAGAVSLADVCSGRDIGVQNTGSPTIDRLVSLVIRGGWPGSLGKTEDQAMIIPREYVENIVNTDINRLDEIERDPVKVRKCLRSLARNESTTVSTATIKDDITEFDDASLGINTVSAYLGAFKRLFLTHDTEPFSPFLRSPVRIKQQSKRRFCDPSIAAALLGATPPMLLRDLRTFGFLFESLAVRDLEVYAESLGAKLYHYQDYDNDEFDAVIQFPDASWSAFEVKYNPADIDDAAAELVRVSAKFARNPPKSLAVVVGKHGIAHRRPDGVYVLPLTALRP